MMITVKHGNYSQVMDAKNRFPLGIPGKMIHPMSAEIHLLDGYPILMIRFETPEVILLKPIGKNNDICKGLGLPYKENSYVVEKTANANQIILKSRH